MDDDDEESWFNSDGGNANDDCFVAFKNGLQPSAIDDVLWHKKASKLNNVRTVEDFETVQHHFKVFNIQYLDKDV